MVAFFVAASAVIEWGQARRAEAAKQAAETRERQRREFMSEIDQRYKELQAAVQADDSTSAERAFRDFQRYGQSAYRNVPELHRRHRTRLLLDSLNTAESPESRLSLYTQLSRLHPDNSEYASRVDELSTAVADIRKKERDQELARKRRAKQAERFASVRLVVESWGWKTQSRFAVAEGQVTNVSRSPLKNLQAVVQYVTADGTFVTSDSSLIDYQPLLPGQTSPFKVMTRLNPAMSNATLTFKQMFGGQVAAMRRVEYDAMETQISGY